VYDIENRVGLIRTKNLEDIELSRPQTATFRSMESEVALVRGDARD